MWVFWLERVVPPLVELVIAVFGVFCYFQTRVTCRPKSRCQSDLSTVSVLANRNLHQDLMHSGCRGTAVPKACPQAFSLFPLPNSPLDQRPVHRLSEHWKRGWTITVKLMTSRMVKGTWLHTGALWRLKGVQKVRSISFYLALWPYQRQYIWPIRSGQL